MEKVDVISIGAINCDIIGFVSKFPEVEEKINSQKYQEYGATGVALDCLTQVARLGMKCGHIGKKGDDYFGTTVEADLAKDGIDSTYCTTIPGMRTALAWVLVNPANGDRCHIMHPAAEGGYTNEEIDALKDYICGAKAVHMEMLQLPMGPWYHLAKMCRENGVVTSMDMDIAPHYMYEYGYSTPELFKKTCAEIDLLKLCSGAVADLSDKEDILEAAAEIYEEYHPTVLIITIGEKGCVIAYKEDGETKVIHVPSFAGEGIIDTTGSGDAFQGGFIYGYLKGYDMKKVGQLANACGFLAAHHVGARGSVKYDEIDAFLKENGCGGLD